jgi:hypothetical protein
VTGWKRTKPSASAVDTSGQFDLATPKPARNVKTVKWVNLWWSSMETQSAYPGRVTLISKPSLNQYTTASRYFQGFASVGILIVSTLNTSKSHRFGLN